MKKTLTHVALIPDGNRRWAKNKKLSSLVGHNKSFAGHEKGSSTIEEVIQKSLEMKIPYLTIWGSSLDNITKRSKSEVNYLFNIFEKQFKKLAETKEIHKNKVKINIIGEWRKYFPQKVKDAIEEAIEKTKGYNNYHLTFLMAYNGTNEMIDCIKKIKEKGIEPNEKNIKENLWTKDLPPVDLIIRTGTEGDPHMSAGFMMWDTAYSQLYFTSTYFPAFTGKLYEKAIKDYFSRERRAGS